jgi:ATP-dependent Clp protease ATP-binding subunit ClpC
MAVGLKSLESHAQRVADKRGHPLTSAHMLLALYQRTIAGQVLGSHGVGELELIEAVQLEIEENDSVLRVALERAERTATALGHGRATPLHLLLSLVRDPRSVAYHCLERLGASPSQLQSAVLGALEAGAARIHNRRTDSASALEPAERYNALDASERRGNQSRSSVPHSEQRQLAAETESKRARDRARRSVGGPLEGGGTELGASTELSDDCMASIATDDSAVGRVSLLDPERFPLLCTLGRDLCSDALAGAIDPVIGRDFEVERVLDVLTRRRANNPVLVGQPGVGKTAIALEVARRLARGEARGLEGRILVELSTGTLLAGTGVRGALSERLQALTQEIERAQGSVILFIDEIHSLIGGNEGGESLVQGLKAALARGELPCLGATTDAEYRRYFERDSALARRFTRVEVCEPSPKAAVSILRGLAPDYERHHAVSYTQAAIEAAVDMSVRYINERQLPDKAVGLLDQAGARARRRGASEVCVDAIAEVVAEHSGVPLERLLMRDGEALLALEAELGRRVVGQESAASALADALRKGAAGFRGNRPLGTFLFLGPTGVGKTEMAKAISELVFPANELTRIDMSELSEAHSVARLLGAPPGYIGHEEGGQLTESVRVRPYQLILLDEIEKAHPEVLLALLPLLDEGRLTDSRGRTVDFKNTVIVMTSNLGANPPESRSKVGFGAEASAPAGASQQDRALGVARKALPPELWNRIDEPLFFAPLSRASVERIAQRLIEGVQSLMANQHGVTVEVAPSAIAALIEGGGYDPALGARPMRRTVGRALEAQLAKRVLAGELQRGDTVRVSGKGAQLHFTLKRRGAVHAAQ